jgi:hypothetical protein
MPIEADITRTFRLIVEVTAVKSGDPDIVVEATLTALYVPLAADGDDTLTFERTCPQDDGYEPNDSAGQATNTYSGPIRHLIGIVCPLDDDWFHLGYVTTQQQSMLAYASFSNAEGNIDTCITNASGSHIVCSATTSDAETVETSAPVNDDYYVRVFLASDAGSPGNTYTLDVSVH